ncbi:unnamed protein product [Camellia sinensis]
MPCGSCFFCNKVIKSIDSSTFLSLDLILSLTLRLAGVDIYNTWYQSYIVSFLSEYRVKMTYARIYSLITVQKEPFMTEKPACSSATVVTVSLPLTIYFILI